MSGLSLKSCPQCHGEGKIVSVGVAGIFEFIVCGLNILIDDVTSFFWSSGRESLTGPGFGLAVISVLTTFVLGLITLLWGLDERRGNGISLEHRPGLLILSLFFFPTIWGGWFLIVWSRSIWRRTKKSVKESFNARAS